MTHKEEKAEALKKIDDRMLLVAKRAVRISNIKEGGSRKASLLIRILCEIRQLWIEHYITYNKPIALYPKGGHIFIEDKTHYLDRQEIFTKGEWRK